MGLERILQRSYQATLLPAFVAGSLLISNLAYAEPRLEYSLPATKINREYFVPPGHHLIPPLQLEVLAQNSSQNEEERPRTYYVNPQPQNPSPESEEPTPLYLLPANTSATTPTYQQPSNYAAEPSRNGENDSLGLGLTIVGGIGTLLGLLLITDDNYTCSGYEGTSDWSCDTTNHFLIPEIVGTVSSAGITGLGIWMLLD